MADWQPPSYDMHVAQCKYLQTSPSPLYASLERPYELKYVLHFCRLLPDMLPILDVYLKASKPQMVCTMVYLEYVFANRKGGVKPFTSNKRKSGYGMGLI